MAQSTPTFRQLIQSPVLLLGFGFGSGLASKGPGTVGTLLGLLLFLPVLLWSETLAWVILALATVTGSWICGRSSEMLGVHDHGGIVWDEFVGIWLVLLCLPEQTGWYWLFAFIAFRIFDIAKPWPISWADKSVSGGFGIMLDDVLAALVAIGFIWASTISLNWLF
ncbi:phosphatidylglycerophosphatase A [Thiomicrorhabdus sp. ZW0627]|uniref:phosphatidylglycerophosphatase A family protein n=1 Tax=Thiomicrorhabdus sp. ZW0627 TaxID=3039774 RepID=UPI0024372C73|nr:phosphatidylglycerophosphatase A [Thiomicrorhabdus sp. ZW0627]MDG6772792.1 phosphatidylglycerophosphatase A [Thiomicrorhabdus sp. ZW0627]